MRRRRGELMAAHEAKAKVLVERESLMRELYHRTRNNMQVIEGILEFEADICGNPAVSKVVADTIERITSMPSCRLPSTSPRTCRVSTCGPMSASSPSSGNSSPSA